MMGLGYKNGRGAAGPYGGMNVLVGLCMKYYYLEM